MANSGTPVWEGLRFPARLLTQGEVDLLSPRCRKCGLTACVVELQQPLSSELEKKQLTEHEDNALQFYCAYHSPIDVPAEMEAATDLAFYETVRKEVLCPKQEFRRFASNCIVHNPNCLKRCTPIRKLLSGLSFPMAKRIIEAAREAEEKRKPKEKENDDPET